MYRSDVHTHSDASPDGHDAPAALAAAAIDCGLNALCVTDHCECNGFFPGDHMPDYRYYNDTRYDEGMAEAAEAVKGRLTLLRGVEIAQGHERPEIYREILASHRFDFVLASLHNLRGLPDFYYIDDYRSEACCNELLARYVSELFETARLPGYDSFAHIGYPVRYMRYKYGFNVSMDPFTDALEPLLRYLAENGKALELNVSGLRNPERITFPSLSVLKLFRAVGGEMVTVGTDAHRSRDIGSHIDDGYELLRQAGFGYHTVFVDRKPVLHRL